MFFESEEKAARMGALRQEHSMAMEEREDWEYILQQTILASNDPSLNPDKRHRLEEEIVIFKDQAARANRRSLQLFLELRPWVRYLLPNFDQSETATSELNFQ